MRIGDEEHWAIHSETPKRNPTCDETMHSKNMRHLKQRIHYTVLRQYKAINYNRKKDGNVITSTHNV